MLIQPQTDAKRILESVNAIIEAGSHFLSSDTFQIKKLIRDANLIKDPAGKLVLLGAIAQICGNKEDLDSKFRAAKLASGNGAVVMCQYSHALWNLGFCSEARKEFLQAQIIENGLLSYFQSDLFGLLAMDFLCSMYARGIEMNITNMVHDKVELAHRAKIIMNDSNISDELASQLLDEAGAVMRDHNVMRFGKDSAEMHVEDENGFDPFLMVTWRLPVTYKEAATMNAELADRLVSRFSNIPDCISIGFEGSRR